MFYHFMRCLPSAMSIVHNDIFIFDNVISISLKVPSITIVFSMGSSNGKNRLSEGHLRFLSKFPFVNLQIKSIVESLRPIMSINEKNIQFTKKICIFGKKTVFRNSQISPNLLVGYY